MAQAGSRSLCGANERPRRRNICTAFFCPRRCSGESPAALKDSVAPQLPLQRGAATSPQHQSSEGCGERGRKLKMHKNNQDCGGACVHAQRLRVKRLYMHML